MPAPINVDSSGLWQPSKTEVSATTMTNQNAPLHLASSQTTHLRLASPLSFTSCNPFSSIFSFGGLSSIVHSHRVKVQTFSTVTVSCHAISMLAFEPVTSTNQNSSANTALKAIAEMQTSANIFQDSGPLAEQPIAATNSSQYNLPADLGLHAVSWNSNKTFQFIVKYSDILVYGCLRVLFKMYFANYQRQEIQLMRDLFKNDTPSFRNWTQDMFAFMCIDYCKGVPGIGIKLAHKLVRLHHTPSKNFSTLRAAGRMLPGFEEKFFIGFCTFHYQRVFCPLK
jgi:hypothetical protein